MIRAIQSVFTPAPFRISLAAAALLAGTAGGALADGLPGELLSAGARPEASEGRARCYFLGALNDDIRFPYRMGDHRTGAAAAAGYSADTVGAYLGEVPRGAAPTPVVQALLDLGVARRVPVTFVQHTRPPGFRVPSPEDLAASASERAAPSRVEEGVSAVAADAFLVSGGDSTFFNHADAGSSSPGPPAMDGSGEGPDFSPDAQRPPVGVWKTDQICLSYAPKRILEYSDPAREANGTSTVGAAVLFAADPMPAWASDLRLATALRNPPLTFEVRFMAFRNDGDGWRPMPFGDDSFLRGRTSCPER